MWSHQRVGHDDPSPVVLAKMVKGFWIDLYNVLPFVVTQLSVSFVNKGMKRTRSRRAYDDDVTLQTSKMEEHHWSFSSSYLKSENDKTCILPLRQLCAVNIARLLKGQHTYNVSHSSLLSLPHSVSTVADFS